MSYQVREVREVREGYLHAQATTADTNTRSHEHTFAHVSRGIYRSQSRLKIFHLTPNL